MIRKYELYGEDFRRNAYQVYAQMRRLDPVILQPGLLGDHIWFVSNYDDAQAILRDHKRFSRDMRASLTAAERETMDSQTDIFRYIDTHMLNQDPPNHTRLRALVSKAFTADMVTQLAPRTQEIADGLIDEVAAQKRMDLIDDYAFLLPITVIAELLGVPVADRDKFRDWSAAAVEPALDEAAYAEFMQKMEAFVAYLGALFAQRRAQPQADLISALLQVEEAGDRLSEAELYSMVFLLLVAGHETTVNLIGNGMVALCQHPEQMALLRQDLSLIPNAIEELLRYDPPVERTLTRFVLEDLEFQGHQMKKGQPVVVILGSANRDETHFEDSESLDITRPDNQSLVFGYGIHYCLGAPLARMEGRVALETLLRRLPGLRLDTNVESLTWRPSLFLRGLTHVPVAWD